MDELLSRGVEQIVGAEELKSALNGKRKLRIKLGVDPTSPDIHLGHAVLLRKLRALQDLGHTVIFLIGDYTTKIGDPSGKSKTRPMLTDAQIKANVKTYLDQVGLILNLKKTEIRYNSEWLKKLTFGDLITLASNLSVAQMIEREDFKTRLENGQELALHELLYPLMQAYDSVALEADVEFGGNDQLFNLLVGRSLQKKLGQAPQIVFIMELLVGTDSKQKMSKSLDNYIAITDPPIDMYGKVMSLPDSLIAPYYKLTTDIALTAIDGMVDQMARGANPRDSKASLARQIVTQYHGDKAATAAEADWNKTFRDHEGPSEDQLVEHRVGKSGEKLSVVLQDMGVTTSNSDSRRLLQGGGVKVAGDTVLDEHLVVRPGDMIQVGKRRFFKLTAK